MVHKTKLSWLFGLVLTAAIIQTSFAAEEALSEKAKAPRIQLAILLDTSSSMSGLIDQAKTQLWRIVNEFATTRKEGKIPELQVALYEYGKDSLPAEQGYMRMIMPLTTDLDKISEELFALQTNGGQEYCGMVIQKATEFLSWSSEKDDFKVIFIAGNEPFTQGTIDYHDACKKAIEKGILVNTIHCGSYEEGVNGQWKDGAVLADGSYMNIDANRKAVYIEAPQDKEIARLGEELNKTYVAYGAMGREGLGRQVVQDRNAAQAAPASEVQRAVSKSSAQYRNTGWDLVDAVAENNVKLEELKKDQIPEEMRSMSTEEQKAFIESKQKERQQIQNQIQDLNKARNQFVTEEMKKRADKGEDTLEAVMIKSIREQITKKNFTLPPAVN